MADNMDWIDDLSMWDDIPIDPEEVNKTSVYDGPQVPPGKYEVSIDKLLVKPSSKDKNKPVLSIWFKILKGEWANYNIFYNQGLDTTQKVGISLSMLRSLCKLDEQKEAIKYTKMSEYVGLIKQMSELIPPAYEYAIEYYETPSKTDASVKFKKVKVLDIFDK